MSLKKRIIQILLPGPGWLWLLYDIFTGDEEDSDGDSSGSGGFLSGSSGSKQTISAIPVKRKRRGNPVELTLDSGSGEVSDLPAKVDIDNREYKPEQAEWVEESTGTSFNIDWDPSSRTGYKIEEGDIEALESGGAISGTSASSKVKSGFIGALLGYILLPFNPIINIISGSDAESIGGSVAKLMIFLVIGGVVLFGALSIFGGSVAQEYLNFFGGATSDRLAGVGANSQVKQTVGTYQQAKARVFCLLSGPSCLRQWRLNNTQRPGSNEVGQSYGLSIDRFQVGQSEQLDVAYKKEGYAIPISFTVSNTRHGLKGIDALNVSYRLRVIDGERGISKPYCDSGWIPVKGFNVRENAQQPWKGNDIYPGTSASTAFLRLNKDKVNGAKVRDKFTLKGCEMMQPALGDFRKVRLDIKYDYFSQATLYFDAMSLQNLQSNPEIQKEFKDSVTADTPVKAAISVNSPVLYDEEKLNTGEDAAQPFGARATLGTDEFDVEYKVKDLEVQKSSEVEISEDQSRDCQFGIGDSQKPVGKEDGDAVIDRTRWFDKDQKPPIFGCVMELSNPGTISPTGETLTMGVEANYSVAKSENIDSFKVVNTRCTEFNCPLIVPREDSGDDGYSWKTVCRGVDASNGCTIVTRDGLQGDSLSTDHVLNKGFDAEIDNGEVAVSTRSIKLNAEYSAEKDGSESAERAFGIDEDKADGIWGGNYYAIIQHTDFNGNEEVEYVELNKDAPSCFKKWKSNNGGKYDDLAIVSYNPQGEATCEQSGDSGSG